MDKVLVERWQRAYKIANGKQAPEITYNYGWYRLPYGTVFRQWKLERMTEALEEKAGIMSPPLGLGGK